MAFFAVDVPLFGPSAAFLAFFAVDVPLFGPSAALLAFFAVDVPLFGPSAALSVGSGPFPGPVPAVTQKKHRHYCRQLLNKENGQTVVSDDLSALAPQELEKLNLIWRDFRKVVRFIDENREWLDTMLHN
ncbi:MAG: hypothetical protein J6Y66_07935 [Bacteroidales bacterium]|nr:hypothetical protein [Bacteroidales bacterium]